MPLQQKQTKVRRDKADATAHSVVDDSEEQRLKIYQDVEERRLKEWENYQRSHRADDDQNPNRAFVDVTVGDALIGRLVFELFDSVTPLTVAHFRALISGYYGVDPTTGTKLDYLHCPLTCINREDNVMVFGSLGRGVAIPEEYTLKDENYTQRHNERGLLTMMSRGPHTAGYAFGITLSPAPVLDYRQVVFGQIVDGLSVLEKLEALPVNAVGCPSTPVTITLCGVLTGERPPGSWSGASKDAGDESAQAPSTRTTM